ncbi:MAG: hypothetical protein SF187_25330 [Deltaproteobacteria bacterium]|nr:hypothetical protein [Deltaproteobacteria bacterium]
MQEHQRWKRRTRLWLCTAVALTSCGDLQVGGGTPDDAGADVDALESGDGGVAHSLFVDLGGRNIIKPKPAFLRGEGATFYDFGNVNFVKGNMPNAAEALAGRTAGAAPVFPMYFFFTEKGEPLFAKPEKNTATGQFFMKGGKDVRAVDGFARLQAKQEDREEDLWLDERRGSADYQRPLVDVLPGGADVRGEKYSGLWEVVKVRVPNGFDPDSVKDVPSLLAAASAATSGIKIEPSGFAINCPIVDARAYVVPTISAYAVGDRRIPQPQIELWHRKKRVDCLLVNGWETLGETIAGATAEQDKYRLFDSAQDDRRVQTFDIDVVPAPAGQTHALVAPVGLMIVPHAMFFDLEKYYDELSMLAGPAPRRKKTDAPGYRPIRWLWNLEMDIVSVEAATERTLRESGLLDPRNISASRLSPRKDLVLRNVGLASTLVGCDNATRGADPCASIGMECGLFNGTQIPFCAAKRVRYNALCGPAIAQCRGFVETSEAGVEKTDVVEKWFVNGNATPAELEQLKSKVGEELLEAQRQLVMKSQRLIQRDGPIYVCAADETGVGRCVFSCNANGINYEAGSAITAPVEAGGTTKSLSIPLDSRCGGKFMPGYACSSETSTCSRSCSPSAAECRVPTNIWYSDEQTNPNLAQGTTCGLIGTVQSCLLLTPSQSLSR